MTAKRRAFRRCSHLSRVRCWPCMTNDDVEHAPADWAARPDRVVRVRVLRRTSGATHQPTQPNRGAPMTVQPAPFAVTWFDRPPDRPVEGTVFVVPADVVHQCTYLDAPAVVDRWVCPCGAVWERSEVRAAGTVWPAWQRAAPETTDT